MAEAFKNRFNLSLIERLAKFLQLSAQKHQNATDFAFDASHFIQQASKKLDTLELKARSKQICDALHAYLPSDFALSTQIIEDALASPSIDETIFHDFQDDGIAGWAISPLCDYISQRILMLNGKHIDRALALLKECTQRFTAEFAIRPLLQVYPEKTLTVMMNWAHGDNVHVRRLVSEGSRPYLPWGIRLKSFAIDPTPILGLLEILKNDKAEYVRRSVANNLNDIAKDHPDLVVETAKRWLAEQKTTSDKDFEKNRHRMLKHACRTLIKQGHPNALALFSYFPVKSVSCKLKLDKTAVKIGESLGFSVRLSSKHNENQNLLIDYVICHLKANGSLSPKVFKWKSVSLSTDKALEISKYHSFKAVTTRQYYEGKQKIQILVNGKIVCSSDFLLKRG